MTERAAEPFAIWLRETARAARWHRRVVAAALLAAAMAFALEVLAPEPPTTPVVVATRTVAAGSVVTGDVVKVVRRPAGIVPDGALPDLASVRGQTTVTTLRPGEMVTDVRLLTPGLAGALADGEVAMPVRLNDPDAAALLRPGDVVDVLAAGAADAGGAARLVASAVRVLAVPRDDRGAFGNQGQGALVVVATSDLTAARLAGASAGAQLSVVLRAGS